MIPNTRKLPIRHWTRTDIQSNWTEQKKTDTYNSGSGHVTERFLGTPPPSPEGTFFDMRGTRHLRHLVVGRPGALLVSPGGHRLLSLQRLAERRVKVLAFFSVDSGHSNWEKWRMPYLA